jgi:hypothetical protein
MFRLGGDTQDLNGTDGWLVAPKLAHRDQRIDRKTRPTRFPDEDRREMMSASERERFSGQGGSQTDNVDDRHLGDFISVRERAGLRVGSRCGWIQCARSARRGVLFETSWTIKATSTF